MTTSPDVAVWIAAERHRLADLCRKLDPDCWDRPSACDGWRIRDVLAHLTIAPRTSLPDMAIAMARARGNFDVMTFRMAGQRAARHSTEELTEQLRASATSTRRMPGSDPMDPLVDLLVHGQDMARPLGIRYPMPAEPALAALRFAYSNPFYNPPDRVAGLRLKADDADWDSSATGLQVRGAVEDLLLVATGRIAALERLTGPGLRELGDRVHRGLHRV